MATRGRPAGRGGRLSRRRAREVGASGHPVRRLGRGCRRCSRLRQRQGRRTAVGGRRPPAPVGAGPVGCAAAGPAGWERTIAWTGGWAAAAAAVVWACAGRAGWQRIIAGACCRGPGTSRPAIRTESGRPGRPRPVVRARPVRAGTCCRASRAVGRIGRAVAAAGFRRQPGGRRKAVSRHLSLGNLIGAGATRHAGVGPDPPGLTVLHFRIAHGASVSFWAAHIARSGIFPCLELALPSLAPPGILVRRPCASACLRRPA